MSITAGCLGKFAYATRADADRSKRHILRKRDYVRGDPLQTYFCRKCGHFHLGRDKRSGGRDHVKTADHHAGSFKQRKAKYEALTK